MDSVFIGISYILDDYVSGISDGGGLDISESS